MKKKINSRIIFIAILAIISTLLIISLVYYNMFEKQVSNDIKVYAQLIGQYDNMEQIYEVSEGIGKEGIRITLIDLSGNVIMDSEADESTMENHGLRPEVVDAVANGAGEDIRKSKTLNINTMYYAVLLESDIILRVSKDISNIYSIFTGALPTLLLVAVVLIGLSFVLAHFLTKSFILPIRKMAENMENQFEVEQYEELTPFMYMIHEQHQNIMKNARMRQEFTANVSHELKTPLTSISGYAELIETGMASEEDVLRFARGIHSNANRLLTLINDIIRLSELDNVEREVILERLNLFQLANNCVETLKINANKHQVNISIEGKETYIKGNKLVLEELLFNLCDNAIRYNNIDGNVWVRVETLNKKAVLTVQDTGIGISKEDQERVFERFYRVDKSRSKITGGTGLGLAIVKHIVAKHHAQLELESETGKGTTIKVIFEIEA